MHIHPAGRLIPVAQPHMTVAVKWNSGSNALILACAELLLLLLLLLRWAVRRQGGWRHARRRLSRQIRLTFGAFSDPVREFLRFRATVRHLTRLLATAEPATVAHRALDDVDTAVTRTAPDAFGFAATVRPASRRAGGDVTVRVAGRGVPAAADPWVADGRPLHWRAGTTAVLERAGQRSDADEGAQSAAQPRVLVPLGLDGEAMVLIDLLRGPGILSTYGDRRASRAFVQAVAAYLDLPGGSAEVVVARGVHPRFDGPDLDSLLASMEGLAPERTRPLVLVCAAPDAGQAARLARMATAGLLCAVVVGPVPAHRWEIRVNSRGRTETPGLGIETDAAPLGPAVARTARRAGALRKSGAGKGAPGRTSPAGPASGSAARPAAAPSVPSAPSPGSPAPSSSPVPPVSPVFADPAPEPEPAGSPAPASPRSTTAPTPPRAAGASRVRKAPAARRAAPPRAVPPQPSIEPPAPAIRELFAEPEITGVSATGTRDAASYATTEDERPNGS
ncbi:hypothetical protein [Streptomyces sp. NBC_01190]|uniref:hypothetical protein n=1 Tax=Streptomyces sp. NBC_01190 TaxID=2903767 RepID=UPI003864E0E2|nr:hypothetical protein OG519_31760 [Streptomyces sp. NBC_01190]